MKVLHLCSYYVGNKLYRNLFKALKKNSLVQTVYVPIRNKNSFNKNLLEEREISIYYDLILKKYHRILYQLKIRTQFDRIVKILRTLDDVDLIHAHTLYSDGGTAYLLKKKFNINYVVSVRNTDINVFYKYFYFQRFFIYKVLINASSVIFISHAYRNKTLELLPRKVYEKIKDKSYVIPNGIEEEWLEKQGDLKNFAAMDLLFIGTLDKNKNLSTVLKTVSKLKESNKKVSLKVVGDGVLKRNLLKQCQALDIEKEVVFLGKLEKDQLISVANESQIFILPSLKETFGISYIEALSRGIPILYTKNEGVDGFFPEGKVGYSINPTNIEDIIRKIELIQLNYSQISMNCINEAKGFHWNIIADEYNTIYKNHLDFKFEGRN